ncbi:Sodium/pantothenate symporter [Posidoniimonas polymericola]|uniref:Sodium/pantothenate symporter n=1 Tax=Posidoniimonas polymericola TaxID=2528002 RepID=A0A5C5ZFX0_9BACT|nr:sodium:solute symporter family protein [Posidoniimonas polymericola]TWT85995.1 Sodium/pantothenate symporter [Posidoniimonas polymericola]
MQPIDWAILPIYLIGITALGAWTARRVHSSGDFFMPRRFGKAMMVTFAFGTGTSSDQAVTVASKTLTNGLSAIWWQWLWLPATPFYWLIAPVMRRLRATTTADVYELRYDRSVGVLFAVVGVASLAAKIGLLLVGVGAMVDAVTGGAVSSTLAIFVVTVLFVTYGMAGGLGAAIVTDFVQGLMTVVFSFLLLPFVLNATGGLAAAKETIAAHNPEMLSLVVPGKIDTFFVVMFSLQALVGIVAYPFIMGVCGAGRTELDGRVGFMCGNILKRVCTAAWSLTALAAVAWYLQSGADLTAITPDHLYGNIAREFLPDVLPGLLGVFLACLLASIMSSCDAIMISSAALFTENVYRPIVPDRPEKHYIQVGRVSSLAVVSCGVLFAFWTPDVVEALNFWFKISPTIGIAFWVGLLWRGATPAGAWAGTLAALGGWFAATRSATAQWLAQFDAAREWHVVTGSGDSLGVNDPWVILAYMTAGVAACVVVSLLTPKTPAERLQRFYDLTRTPITPDEEIERPCMLPLGVAPAERPMLTTFAGLEIPMPSATSWAGFAAGWAMVAALIGGFLWIVG